MRRPIRVRRKMPPLRRIQVLSVLSGVPGIAGCFLFLYLGGYPMKVYLTVIVLVLGAWLAILYMLRDRIIRPLQSASNMLSGLREGDFSIQSGAIDDRDALGQLMLEINQLTDVLLHHRLGAIEAQGLVNQLVDTIDVAVLSFDPEKRLNMVNKAGLKLLGLREEEALGKRARDIGMEGCLDAEACVITFGKEGARKGRWTSRSGSYHRDGRRHNLLMLTEISQPLREEERTAWKRLIRVLGHELNNSMAPIKSIAASLRRAAELDLEDGELKEDITDGLAVISTRVENLNHFMQDYARLAKLPPPNKNRIVIGGVINRVASLSQDVTIRVRPGPSCEVDIDTEQIEQLLINLIKNAVEASATESSIVEVWWEMQEDSVQVFVQDEGPGIANPTNLFIPFFTTKAKGSGIGLTLSRQIAEAHNGDLHLENRTDHSGCRATLTLPLPK